MDTCQCRLRLDDDDAGEEGDIRCWGVEMLQLGIEPGEPHGVDGVLYFMVLDRGGKRGGWLPATIRKMS